jgi:pilus assembly protein Flp/PilA
MAYVSQLLRAVAREEDGATMPEYALMVALIALVCVAAVTLLGGAVNGRFAAFAAQLLAA